MKSGWLSRDLVLGPYLALCLNEIDFKRRLKEADPEAKDDFLASDHADATTHYWRTKDKKPIAIVTMRVDSSNTAPEVAGLLVHEAVHIFDSFCEHIGENRPSSEFKAYSIQSIAQRLIGSFQEQTQAPKKARRKRGRKV